MPQLIARSTAGWVDHRPLTAFGLGVGVHLDTDVDSSNPDASTVAFLREVGVVRYRVNVRWSAIVPGTGSDVDHVALDRLGATVERLLDAGIEPLVALDNVSLPDGLRADGGWRNAATARAYGDFVGSVGARLGDIVDQWLTFAAAQPRNFEPSMTPALIAAQTDASRILRAHAPHAALGASVDITQFEPATPGEADSAHAWVSHLGSQTAAADFIALNIDRPANRSAVAVADTIRSLHGALPGRSFVLTEADATVGSGNRTSRLVDLAGPERYGVVDAFLDQIRQLRIEMIDVNGTFVWPFGRSTPSLVDVTDVTVEGYRRIMAAGVA